MRAVLERFCAGVNAAAASAKAPPFEMQLLRRREFEPWRPADVLSLGKLLAFGLATNWERELMRSDLVRALGAELAAKLDPSYPVGNPIATQEPWSGDGIALVEQIDAVRRTMGLATEASGSNNWAVSGRLSATGSPLIAATRIWARACPVSGTRSTSRSAIASSGALPCRDCRVSSWVRTTTSAGPSPM